MKLFCACLSSVALLWVRFANGAVLDQGQSVLGVGSGPFPCSAGAEGAPTAAGAGPEAPSTSPASAAIRQEASGSMGILRGRSPGM